MTGRRVLATVCAASAVAMALPATANASPKSNEKQDKAKLQKLNSQADRLTDKYNKAREEWQAAQAKVNALNKSVATQQKTYGVMRLRVAQLASTAYKNGDNGSVPDLVAAKDPQTVLDQMSAFTQISRNQATQVTQFLNAAQLLKRQQAQAAQATEDLKQQKLSLAAQKNKVQKLAAQQQKLVNKYSGSSSSSSGQGGTYNGPASGSARKALQFAYSKLGTPYLYGGTGPRYDCSGLTMMAWKAGGVSIPRVVPDQYNATKRVAKANLQPGDLVFFDGLNHVGMYVGGGKFIHSPHTGDHVKISSLSESWYASQYVGAGRP